MGLDPLTPMLYFSHHILNTEIQNKAKTMGDLKEKLSCQEF